MACNNSPIKNNQLNKSLKTQINIYFNNISEKLLEQNWQYKDTQFRHGILTKEQIYNNIAAWQINYLEKLLTKIEKDLNRVLSIILDM